MDIRETLEAVLRSEEYKNYGINMGFYSMPLENIKLLLDIWNKEKNSEDILRILLECIKPPYFYLVFEFLIRIKEIKLAFINLKNNLEVIKKEKIFFYDYYVLFNRCLGRLVFVIENVKFTADEIEEIRKEILKSSELEIKEKTTRLRRGYTLGYDNKSGTQEDFNEMLRYEIKKELDFKKLEIVKNRYSGEILKEDLEIIQKELEGLDFSEDAHKALKEIKNSKPENEEQYSKDISFIRSFLDERIIEEIAKKISFVEREPINKVEKGDKYKSYLKIKKIIDEKESKLINAIHGILSKGGSHTTQTISERYRLLKNISIEIIVLLLANFKRKYPDIKSKIEYIKSEEILSGTANWGGPILYGKTPEENLELLKGYEGELIEKMREKLLDEVNNKEN